MRLREVLAKPKIWGFFAGKSLLIAVQRGFPKEKVQRPDE